MNRLISQSPLPAVLILLLIGFGGTLFAGTTGKITGTVRDGENGEPLIGTNVMVAGTSTGAATDLAGDYVILNIPPGTYTLRFMMMGYQEVVVENVLVRTDLTTTVNMEMNPAVIEGETVSIVAERPLIQMDMTGSMSAVSADEIESLPVQNVTQVLELQAGVVQSGGIHIRGGRSGEVAYWVDGVATTDVFSGGMGVEVENSAISELQVISGTFNAEYGQAMSGIVNIVTKEGGREYTGKLEAWVGDYVSGDDTYSILKNIREPGSGEADFIGESENPLARFNPNYNVEATLSGPVPLLGDKLTFFANGRYVSDEGYLYGRAWFLPTGVPGDSALVPMNPYERYSAQAKLTYQLSGNLKINYNGIFSSYNQERTYSHGYKYNPYGVPQREGSNSTHILTLNHVLSPKTFYELKINRFDLSYEQYVYQDPNAKARYLVTVLEDTTLGIEQYTFDPNSDAGQSELDRIRAQQLNYRFVADPTGPLGYVHPDSSRQPTAYSYLRAGQNLSHYYRTTAYWLGKFDLTSQIDKRHQLKTGVELRLHELTLDDIQLQRKLQEGKSEEVVPFEPWVPPVSNRYHDVYNRKPREFSIYVQDKIEVSEIILNLGLRYDYFDANSIVLADPKDPNIYEPLLDENRYVNPDAPEEERVEYTPEQRREFMHKNVDPKTQLSPRLGIAYPITDKGVIHFSYGHFFQIPNFQYLYASPDFKFSKGGALEIVGNADLKPQRSVMYEIGLQQQISENISLDVTLFYRDIRDWVGTGTQVNTYLPAISYVPYENKDYSNVRGVTLKLERRFANNYFAKVDYTFQIAEGTYSNPEDAFNSLQQNEEPRLALLPLNWDQNHTLNAALGINYRDWVVSLIGRYWTGRPYTPSFPRGMSLGSSAYSGLRENSARLPHVRSLDMYVNRRFSFGRFAINLFINVYNVLDIRDETAVYSDTGSADYSTLIDPRIFGYNAQRIGTLSDYINQPGWYTSPRQIQLGTSVEF